MLVDRNQVDAATAQIPAWPVLVKPAWEGSSKGIRGKCIVDGPSELPQVLTSYLRDYRQPVLVEEYIEGDELTVGILGNESPQILGIMRMLPTETTERFIYSLEVKRDWERLVRYECPAQLEPAATARIIENALAAYRVLGCRDVSRLDFRLRAGVPYFLEVNPLPGLNPKSGDIVLLSQLVGWTYQDLVGGILKAALARCGRE
jgi:D-alanine-D-alanine ligase